jgi:hypothetical protein
MRALLKDPSLIDNQWIIDLFDTGENHALHNEFINAGTGMPARLLLQLPQGLVEAENGLEEIAHVATHLEQVSDDAAEVVAEWLSQPPVVTEARKHLLGETLAEWRRMLQRAVEMDSPLSEVQQRLSLKKMTARLTAVAPRWAALGAMATVGTEPSVKEVLAMLEGLAAQFTSVRSTQQESARLAAYFAGGSVGGSNGGKGKGKKKANGVCWAWQRGSCTRGKGCRFRHSEGVTDSPTDACINVGVATGADSGRSRVSELVCAEVAGGFLDAVTGEACARGADVAGQMAQSVSSADGMRSVYVACEGDIPARAAAGSAVARA